MEAIWGVRVYVTESGILQLVNLALGLIKLLSGCLMP